MTIRFAFRKGAKGFFSRAIRFVTKSQDGLSHVEAVFENGRSFSSREPKGTAWEDIVYAKADWIMCEVADVTPEQYEAALWVTRHLNGLPYDFFGIVRLYMVKSKNNQRQFCSEVCTRIAQACGLARHLDPNLTSPQRLYDALAENPRVKVVQ